MPEKFGAYGENLYGTFLYAQNDLILDEDEVEGVPPDLMRYYLATTKDNSTMQLIQKCILRSEKTTVTEK